MSRAGVYAIHTEKLRFRSDGRWYADGAPVLHKRLALLFSRYLRRKPTGGYEIWIDERYHADVEVQDTPYVVTALSSESDAGVAAASLSRPESAAARSDPTRPPDPFAEGCGTSAAGPRSAGPQAKASGVRAGSGTAELPIRGPAAPGFVVQLNDGTSERLDPDTLRVGAGNILYCRVKGSTERARFLRPVYYQLAQFIEEAGGGQFRLRCGDVTHVIAQL